MKNMVTLPRLARKIIPTLWRISAAFALVGLLLQPAWAADSNNFQIDNDQAGPTHFQQSSSGFTIDGSIEPIIGDTSSNNFGNEVGSPTLIGEESETAPETPGSGGGNTLQGRITVNNTGCPVIYKNLVNFSGTRTANIIYMFLNSEISGFHFPTSTTWEKTAFLQEGSNRIEIWGRDANHVSTDKIVLNLNKVRMGDVNQDGVTDDYDLSMLTRKWNTRGDCSTDFNRDFITDDYDLSLLAAYWSNK